MQSSIPKEFELIYEKICETERMPASDDLKEARKIFMEALNEYIAAVGKEAFYWGYTIAKKENSVDGN